MRCESFLFSKTEKMKLGRGHHVVQPWSVPLSHPDAKRRRSSDWPGSSSWIASGSSAIYLIASGPYFGYSLQCFYSSLISLDSCILQIELPASGTAWWTGPSNTPPEHITIAHFTTYSSQTKTHGHPFNLALIVVLMKSTWTSLIKKQGPEQELDCWRPLWVAQ